MNSTAVSQRPRDKTQPSSSHRAYD